MSSEKTEQPTPKRLRDARERGEVAKSQEVPSTLAVLAVFGVVWVGAGHMTEQFKGLILRPVGLLDMPFEQALGIMLPAAGETFLLLSLPAILCAAGAGAAGHLIQAGFSSAGNTLMAAPP
jgi:type III secretion protein U